MSLYYQIPVGAFSHNIEKELLNIVVPSFRKGGVSREGGLRRNRSNTMIVFSLPDVTYPKEYLELVAQFKRTKSFIENLMLTPEWVADVPVE